MPAGFTFIEQYRTMAKDLEQQSCDVSLHFDEETRHFLNADIKTEIKLETPDDQPDIYSIMECIINNDGNTSATTTNNTKNCSNFLNDNCQKNSFPVSTGSHHRRIPVSAIALSSCSAVTTTPPPPLFSSSPSPMMSSVTLSPMSPFSTSSSSLTMPSMSSNYASSKTSTFVTELAGSGCTVVSNPDFLLDTSSTCHLDGQEDSLQYTDLDKQSMYDEFGHFSSMSKPGTLSDESNSVPLEEAVFMMTGTLQSDCDNLGVPYDPLTWTNENVRRWVSWVCKRNHVPDVSHHLYQFDGRALCSLSHDDLSNSLAESGIKISNELELLKAAYSCFPNQIIGSILDDSVSSNHMCNPYMESLQTYNSLTNCVSPVPSTCSSTHDSNTSTLSTHSDHSDDESGYGSQISSYSVSSKLAEMNDHNRISAKVPTGRGHKQTIHLWQFLKELLLSKDNNYNDCIRWLDRKAGVFKIEDSKRVASLWGARKNRPAMNYDKLSRSVRQYYKKGIIKKTEQSKRLVYQFCSGYM